MLKLTYGPRGFHALSLPEGYVLKNIAWGFQLSGDEGLDCPYVPFVGRPNHPTESSCFTVLIAPDTEAHLFNVSVTLTELFGENKVIARATMKAGSLAGHWGYANLLTWLEKVINKQLSDWEHPPAPEPRQAPEPQPAQPRHEGRFIFPRTPQ